MDWYNALYALTSYVALAFLSLLIIGAATVLLVSAGCSDLRLGFRCRKFLWKLFSRRAWAKMAERRVKDDLEPYRQKMKGVVGMYFRFPSAPSRILEHLYIGSEGNATNIRLLREMGITHIINTVESYCKTGPKYYGPKVKYMGFEAEDDEDYDILQHHKDVYAFIEDARKSGGKAFIHCIMGINRSGALAISYTMVHKHMGPIATTKMVKRARQVILTNYHFQEQVIHFANDQGLLILDKDEL